MKIFVVYDSNGFIWQCTHSSFQSAVDGVTRYLDQENQRAFKDGFFRDHEDRPAKLESKFTYKDEQGGVLVAHNELDKLSTFVKELDMY